MQAAVDIAKGLGDERSLLVNYRFCLKMSLNESIVLPIEGLSWSVLNKDNRY